MDQSKETYLKQFIRNIPDFPKEGIMFKDISPLLEHPEASNFMKAHLLELCKEMSFDAIAGIDSRGFLFGNALAQELNVPFIMIRKKGKLPAKKTSVSYDLEYGKAEIEIHNDAIKPNYKILIHDDLLATGGSANAAAELIKKCGGEVAGFLFLINLSFLDGKEIIKKHTNNIISTINF